MSKMSSATSLNLKYFPKISDEQFANQKLKDFLLLYNETYPIEIKNIFSKPKYKNLLLGIFSASPYLTRLIFNNISFMQEVFDKQPNILVENIYSSLLNQNYDNINQLMTALRSAKSKIALVVGLADLSGLWTLKQITRTLSEFAELSLKLTVNYLLNEARDNQEIELPHADDASRNCGYVILGMGKLGGYELNYSSDIDLIVLFDLDIVKYTGRKSAQDFFVKLTQKLVKILAERTADGYVFRMDLRLRPDPGATPVALSMEGAETYYQSVGLNWERAAMIKARPVAGDIDAGYAFLERIRRFVWRKFLDYAAIDDIHAIKKLIHQHHSHSGIKLKGHDVKLGRGGIREIEFYAQIHQLIAGGREPQLRIAPTCGALNALQKSGKLDKAENEILQDSYVYLRTVEHRLQMINDDQTHEIPTSDEDLYRLTRFMGYDNLESFEKDLIDHLNCVHDLFNNLLQDTHQADEDISLSFPLDRYHPATLAAIEAEGFNDPKKIYKLIQNWQIGRYRACRTERARTILKQLVPEILKAFGHHNDPEAGLVKFDDFLSRLPSGVQLFSFIKAQPWLLELLAQIMGMAPYLSNQLSRNPLLLDSVISTDTFNENISPEALTISLDEQLGTALDFQDTLDITRKWANEGKFQVGLQILRGHIDVDKSGEKLTLIAETALKALLEHVKSEFAKKHGTIENSSICVLAMGKLGGFELTSTSDIDMVFIYDAADMGSVSNGEKQLSVNHYYARLCQNFINSITALTGEGKLYEVDMRLRPSGTSGPLAVNIDSFSDYQAGQAWTWEHMALTRARVITDKNRLRKKVETLIHNILTNKNRDQEKLLFDLADMRQRLASNFPTDNPWAMKNVRGGIIDIEFICQYLLLKHGREHPEILEQNTFRQILMLADAKILTSRQGRELSDACHIMQTIQVLLRLCLGTTSKNNERPPALIRSLAERLKTKPEKLEPLIASKHKSVLDLYNKIIEIPAGKLGLQKSNQSNENEKDHK